MSHTGRKAASVQHRAAKRKVWVWIAIGATVALVSSILLLEPATREPVVAEGDPTLGAGPLDVFYFADFQCPFCAKFEAEGMDGFRSAYIDTGRVRLVFKDYPIIGDDSWSAARASQAVWTSTPDAYWAWHRHIFEAQGPERSGWASEENLLRLSANVAGVDVDAIRAAFDDTDTMEEVRADRAQGADAGVRATPSLLIGGRIVNANDADGVRAAIEAAEAG